MKIVIAGAGEMGSHLARMLSGNGHDITVIDGDQKLLSEVSSLADVITVEGDSTIFAVLRKAAVRKCDLFIAVNHEENANVVAAMLAKKLGAKKSIARIDNNEYLEPNNKEMFIDMGIDYLFYPEKVAAREVINLLGHTSTTEYVDFSSGKLSLVVFRLEPASPLVGQVLTGFADETPLSYRTVAITRGGQTIIPREGEQFMEGDTVYVIARQDAVREVMEFSGKSNIEIKNMMILGGSRIGIRIATELQDEVNIKLVDYNADKAYRLAEMLDKTLIINEDGRNTEAMMEEGLANMDAFVAVTGRSETNILAAMLAKRMGVKKVIAEVENMNYINLRKYYSETLGQSALSIIHLENGVKTEFLNTRIPVEDKPIYLRLYIEGRKSWFEWSYDGENYEKIGRIFDTTRFSDEYCKYGEFTGTMVGLTCADRILHRKCADFDFFEYKADESRMVE